MVLNLANANKDQMIRQQNFANFAVGCLPMIALASEFCLDYFPKLFQYENRKINGFFLFFFPSIQKTETNERSSFEWNQSPYDVPDLYAKPGTPCDNYNGYCDVNQRCREVDPSSPLATLRRLLLSNESMASLKRWFNEQWFYIAVLILITVLILVLFHQ